MKLFYKRASWTDIIMSFIFLALGVLLTIAPTNTVNAISVLIGIIFIAQGLLKLIDYYSADIREDNDLCVSLVSIVLGSVLLFVPDFVNSMFRIIIGIWIIAMGTLDLQAILMWKERKSAFWTISFIISVVMIIAGLVVVSCPGVITSFVGLSIIVYSVLDIIDRIIFMKKINNYN